MLRKFQGEPLKLDHVLAFCQASFHMTLSWARFLRLAPSKVRSDAVKNNIAQEPGMSGPSIKANWKWSNKRWQE